MDLQIPKGVKKRHSIMFQDELWSLIQHKAKQESKSKSEIIRAIIIKGFKMKYKIRKNITFDPIAIELFEKHNIRNISEFVNRTIINHLSDKDFQKKQYIREVTRLQGNFESIGIIMEVELKEKTKEGDNVDKDTPHDTPH